MTDQGQEKELPPIWTKKLPRRGFLKGSLLVAGAFLTGDLLNSSNPTQAFPLDTQAGFTENPDTLPEALPIPVAEVQKTLQEIKEKVDAVQSMKAARAKELGYVPISSSITRIGDRTVNDITQLQALQKDDRPSDEDRATFAGKIFATYNTAPTKGESIPETKFDLIEGTVDGDRIINRAGAILKLFPEIERAVTKISVEPRSHRSEQEKDAGTITGAGWIFIRNHPVDMREDPNSDTWSDAMLDLTISHELGHATDIILNEECYARRSFTDREKVELAFSETIILEEAYKTGLLGQQNKKREDEFMADLYSQILQGTMRSNMNQRVYEAGMNGLRQRFSILFGPQTYVGIMKQLQTVPQS